MPIQRGDATSYELFLQLQRAVGNRAMADLLAVQRMDSDEEEEEAEPPRYVAPSEKEAYRRTQEKRGRPSHERGVKKTWVDPKELLTQHRTTFTRAGKKAAAEVVTGARSAPVGVPKVDNQGRKLWAGVRTGLSFRPEVEEGAYTTWAGTAGNHNTGTFGGSPRDQYRCSNCNEYFPRKGKAAKAEQNTGRFITLDHRPPVSETLAGAEPVQFTVDGHLWEAVLLEEAQNIYNTHSELRPMCQSCNSSSGGTKGIDPSPPKHLLNCPGCR